MGLSNKKSSISRRKFFTSGAVAAAGFAILNSLPGRVFAKAKKKSFAVKITEHPSAIKRTK
ncbi:MAG: hypothetical protein SCALA702_28890 [Melioribacteraceae bacterium]|nr:MAG: hypothetical protein SCALA702_28890 [Melioribacteraceae bacterium]